MDSYTQIILGAAVGEATLGKKAGARAPFWGGIAGLVPDLDPYLPPHQTALEWIFFHRGYSHSILFTIIFGLFMGWVISRIHRKQQVGWKQWSLLSFLGLFTHIILDSLTTFGTQVFRPFSDYRVEWSIMPFMDYVYSGILLVSVVACLFFARHSMKRRWIIFAGLALSILYIGFAGMNKIIFHQNFIKALEKNNIAYREVRTTPTIYNVTNWYGLAKTEDGFFFATHSAYGEVKDFELYYLSGKQHLIEEWKDTHPVKRIRWFTKGFYNVRPVNGGWRLNDMRFGSPLRKQEEGERYVFSFRMDTVQMGDSTIVKIKWANR